jgi:serine/threonine-protein kinase
MAELMYKIANEPAPDIRQLRQDLPERLAQVVALALAKRPEARYQDGDQFAAELRALIALPAGGPAVALSLASAERAQAEAEKTLVLAAACAHAGSQSAAAPGYDPAQTRETGPAGSYDKTAVFSRTDATAAPSTGGAPADPQA